MKKLNSLILASLAFSFGLGCAVAFGAWSQVNTLNYSTDTGVQGVTKLDNEIDLVYTHLNSLNTLSAAGSEPSSPDTNDTYLDIATSTEPVLKFYTGSAWKSVQPQPVGVFHVYRTDNVEAVLTSVAETILFDVEVEDDNAWYAAATGRHTPQRAGLYEYHACSEYFPTAATTVYTELQKNGSRVARKNEFTTTDTTTDACVSAFIAMNGTTDYVTVLTSQTGVTSLNLQSDDTFGTAFWGRWIGRSE